MGKENQFKLVKYHIGLVETLKSVEIKRGHQEKGKMGMGQGGKAKKGQAKGDSWEKGKAEKRKRGQLKWGKRGDNVFLLNYQQFLQHLFSIYDQTARGFEALRH